MWLRVLGVVRARPQLLLVPSHAHRDLHPCALVKAVRTSQALAVHAQPDPHDATRVKGAERLLQQRPPDASLAPGTKHRHLPDPALPWLAHAAQRGARDLVAALRQEPEGGIEALADPPGLPVLEAAWRVGLVIAKALLDGFVRAPDVLRAAVARSHADTRGPLGRRWRRVERDVHAEIEPREDVTPPFEQRAASLLAMMLFTSTCRVPSGSAATTASARASVSASSVVPIPCSVWSGWT
jgi:hypothetical protein